MSNNTPDTRSDTHAPERRAPDRAPDAPRMLGMLAQLLMYGSDGPALGGGPGTSQGIVLTEKLLAKYQVQYRAGRGPRDVAVARTRALCPATGLCKTEKQMAFFENYLREIFRPLPETPPITYQSTGGTGS